MMGRGRAAAEGGRVLGGENERRDTYDRSGVLHVLLASFFLLVTASHDDLLLLKDFGGGFFFTRSFDGLFGGWIKRGKEEKREDKREGEGEDHFLCSSPRLARRSLAGINSGIFTGVREYYAWYLWKISVSQIIFGRASGGLQRNHVVPAFGSEKEMGERPFWERCLFALCGTALFVCSFFLYISEATKEPGTQENPS